MLMLVLFSLLMRPGDLSVNAVTYHLISARVPPLLQIVHTQHSQQSFCEEH